MSASDGRGTDGPEEVGLPGGLARYPLALALWHTTVVIALLTLGYFLFPLHLPRSDAVDAGRLAGSLAALALVAVVLRREARRSRTRQSRQYHRIQQLLTALYVLVLFFAMVYAVISAWRPGEFAGLQDRVDSLYFSTTVVSTVGFGDVHAEGNLARVVVTVHMLFNLIYLGTALRLLTARAPQP